MRTRLALFVAAALLAGCKPSTREIEGSVFIATKSGEVFKLAAVEVLAVSAPEGRQHLDQAKKLAAQDSDKLSRISLELGEESQRRFKLWEAAIKVKPYDQEKIKPLQTSWDDASRRSRLASDAVALAEARAAVGSDAFAKPWPKVLASTQTDADAKFKLTVPAGQPAALAVRASRTVGKEEERYYWFLPVPPDAKGPVHLSNANLLR